MAFNKRTHPDHGLEIAMTKDNNRSDLYNSPATPVVNAEHDDLYHALTQKKLDRECYDLLYQDEGGSTFPLKRYMTTLPSDFNHKKPVTGISIFQPIIQGKQSNPLLVTVSEDKEAKVWDLYSGQLKLNFTKHENKIIAVATHAKSGKVVTGSDDCTAMIWDPFTGEVDHVLNRDKDIHSKSISTIAICDPTPDPTVVIIGSYDKGFSVWDLASGKLHYHVTNTGHTDLLLSLTPIHEAGGSYRALKIVTGSWDKTIRYFEWETRDQSLLLKGHTKSVTTVVAHMAQVGEHACPILVSGSLDKTAIIWDLHSKEKIRVLRGHEEKITTVRVYDSKNDGCPPLVITSSEDKTAILWDMLTGEKLRVLQHSNKVTAMDVFMTYFGSIIVTADGDCDLTVWNLCRTERIRKLKTKAVTAIDTYSPRDGERGMKSLAVIGSIDSNCTIFEVDSGVEIPRKLAGHKMRINAAVIYTPGNINDAPLVITCAGDASIKVWDLFSFKELRSLDGHKIAVFTIGLYDPKKCSRDAKNAIMGAGGDDLDLNRPMIITGGIDKDIKIWNFLTDDSEQKCLKTIPAAHSNFIRTIAVHHPEDSSAPTFVTGSYDMTAIVWNLQTGEKLRTLGGVHKGFVFTLALYDPFSHLGEDIERLPAAYRNPIVVQASYDGTTSIWNLVTGKLLRKLEDVHKDSVTALAIYTPHFVDDDPLVVTGGIDKMVIIWNLITGEHIQTLVGHGDRVCFIHIYVPPDGMNPLILSGSDDETTIIWEDSLYQSKLMPLRDAVNRAFDADLHEEDWPMITEMAQLYGAPIFVENSNLFFLAVKHNRPDFLLKFRKFLTRCLCHVKTFGGERLLTYAVKNKDLIAVRTILLSWTERLNTDITDMLTQRLYHPSYFFPDNGLRVLAALYPVELVDFVTSLRLVRNHESLLEGSSSHILDSGERYEVLAVHNPATSFSSSWKLKFERVNLIQDFIKWKDNVVLRKTTIAQSVTSMMIPLKNTARIETLSLFAEVSTLLDNVDIFDCPVGVMSLRYFWDEHGIEHHMSTLVKYVLSMSCFLLCLYIYQFQYDSSKGEGPKAGVMVLNILTILMFTYYLYDEGVQIQAKYKRLKKKANDELYRKELQPQFYAFLISHFCFDLWNFIDVSVSVTGIVGVLARMILDRDSPTGRCFLALTSVLLWFKLLYFMRPFSSSGPLVAMILQIACNIRFFLFVLFCVLAGFAQAFWLLSNVDESLAFGTVKKSLQSAFFYMLGDVSADFEGTVAPDFAIFLLVIFMLVMMILMLNLLIALMGDTFAYVRSKGLALWRKEQAEIMFDQIYELADESATVPPHVHVLKYTSEVSPIETTSKLLEIVEASKMHVTGFTELEDTTDLGKIERLQKELNELLNAQKIGK